MHCGELRGASAGGACSADGAGEPLWCSSPQTTCTDDPSAAAATVSHDTDGKRHLSPLSSAFSLYSRRFGSAALRSLRTTQNCFLRVVGWSDDGDAERTSGCGRQSYPFLHAGLASRGLRSWYEALPTTRLCAKILPQEGDGPLILHIALLLVTLEVTQATTFYFRHRHAMRASAKEVADGVQACGDCLADAEGRSDVTLASLPPATPPALPLPEMESARTGRSCQPQGSSRAMRRLCSYWALIERAVQAAPRKRAGVPTAAAELGWFFRSAFPGHSSSGGGGDDRTFGQFTSDGVPHGAEAVLVLPDEIAFPILTGPGKGQSRETPFVASVAASTVTAEPVEVAEPWKVLHLLWTDVVRYSVTYGELRQLLLGCTVAEIAKLFEDGVTAENGWLSSCTTRSTRVLQSVIQSVSRRNVSGDALASTSCTNVNSPLHPSAAASFSTYCVASPNSRGTSPRHHADPRVAVACLALTWYLSLVREVYEAVIVHEDVQRCADALEELEEYSRAVYQHGIGTGAAFFEKALHSVPNHSVGDASGSSSSSSITGRVADTKAGHVSEEPHHREHLMVLPEVVSRVNGELDDALMALAESMAGHVHPRDEYEKQGNDPLCSDTVDDRPASLLSPRAREGGASVTTTHIRLRGASPQACWAELTAALAALLRRRRLMVLSHVRSLFSYMYTESAAKLGSFALLTLLTCLSSRVAAVGLAAREAISANLDTYYRSRQELSLSSSDGGSESGSCDGGAISAQQRIFSLCLFECMRLAVNTVLTHTTHECITVAASQRRNAVKAKLYEALTRLPLAFFDLHSFDEVELMVYYVNDIEGVEVHVHQYVCVLVKSVFAMQHAMYLLPQRARFLVGATVAVSLAVKYIGQGIKKWVQAAQRTGGVLPPWLRGLNRNGTASVMAELDAQVEENTESNARQGGVMLRGLDIVAVLPQLRPYAADLSLMRWWMNHINACGATVGSTEAATFVQSALVLMSQAYGKLLPALGGALMTFADWGLPTLVASYSASIAFCNADTLSLSNRLIEAMRCVGDTVDALADGRRVVEVVLLNAYKASVLEKMLDSRRWEPIAADYAKSFLYNGVSDEPDIDDDNDHNAGARSGTRSAEAGSARYDHRRRLLRSFCRADSHTTTTTTAAWPAFLTTWGVRGLRRNSFWYAVPVPHIQAVGGCLRLAWRGLVKVGRMMTCRRGSSRGPSRSPHRHRRRRRHLSRHVTFLSGSHPPAQQEDPPQSKSHRPRSSGSAGEAMEACSSSQASEDDCRPGACASSSVSSFSDGCDVDGEAAAEVLASATVYAVTVQNLQFYYPTAPTVPVFPRPITCSFALQGNTDSSSSPSRASRSHITGGCCRNRGRLVCLVGPSGHGKSTLLSLLLGMYTNYGTSSDTLDVENDSKSSVADTEQRQEGDSEAPEQEELPFTRFSPVVMPDIILTLSLPHTPPPSSEDLEMAGSHDVTSSPAAVSMLSEKAYVQISAALIPRDILRGNLFSFVPQSPIIFSGATIAHNISLENYISLEQEDLLAEIAQCAAWAHCEYIQRFPQGLMTYLVESGTGAWASPLASSTTGGGGGGRAVRLSGGQAQRLMMARALFHGRRGGTVLVMDEPTASLDKDVKLQILEELHELLDRGIVRGMICATHDDDLIAVADEVVHLP
ncbi:hypothetical protein JKF63_07531 [Porcisia hertigi]|uniref:AAA+ ATPase domain-containing protein n=1 Tax=Porcisia hertigi TaxID=2761500 RepID=A0A836LF23_9TRYP|nr:hypothetical protein JKF63_07531 [Porcisia hertigi]